MTFGYKLKELRMARGASQRGLAALLKMDAAYLSRIENDVPNHMPSAETIQRIIKALRLTQTEGDMLFTLASRLPPDIESKLLSKPQLFEKVRRL